MHNMSFHNPFRLTSNSGDQTIENPSPYVPLIDAGKDPTRTPAKSRRPSRVVVLLLAGLLAVALNYKGNRDEDSFPFDKIVVSSTNRPENRVPAVARGVEEGVSAKSFIPLSGSPKCHWTNKMLTWQRTAYHFQPKKNWMNDPNGPVFYKGWYHFFYQYNPYGAVWGNIVWGHAVSRDLIHWRHLPIAMVPDHWYDINGVWTGSATILPNGQLVMLYTGSTNESVQVQNLAYPADPSDPLLIDWIKYSGNPVLVPPPGIHYKDFRDPTTAWLTPKGKWRITIGSKVNKTGISLVYDTTDFISFELLDGVLHGVAGTGMWECVDFYPVSKIKENGLDTSANGPGVKHVLKTSLDDDRNDYYALGTYDSSTAKWTPDNPIIDVGIGLRYDYGIFYASKTFYDQEKNRRVLWGWIKETDTENTDIQKGWSSVQAIPRTILLDKKTGSNLVLWPVEEVETLRLKKKVFDKLEAKAGEVVPLEVGSVTQIDIMVEFEVDKNSLDSIDGANTTYSCNANGGAAERGALGPFGLLVLTDNDLTEQTPIYFYISKDAEGNFKTFFCADHSRSSKATDVDKGIYGSTVPVLKGEKLSMRILVDHSIVESFAQGGRTCITSRIYPTTAVGEHARLFLFNNATDAGITASLQIWQMSSAYVQ
ncbi:acid beta-fructofuranosidase 2, vacuolar-like [Olea europaea var. sylvestris]|uniref:acid beta-fructofuranosidase 2, vacuolar-like n=1 Tax=Olea europaea var. sylvestris TaxID=158386 RepID=UPI000C1D777B|nr:acid beta-fructofuranosidase 2, vacuolar-like [Olea europaea var. sylvestris]